MRYANKREFQKAEKVPKQNLDTLGIEPRASRMLSGCDTTTPCARCTLTKSKGEVCNAYELHLQVELV